jgi:hypothetical protein
MDSILSVAVFLSIMNGSGTIIPLQEVLLIVIFFYYPGVFVGVAVGTTTVFVNVAVGTTVVRFTSSV